MRFLSKDALGFASLGARAVLIVGTGREGVAVAAKLQASGAASRIVALDGNDGDSAAAWRARFGGEIPLYVIDPATSSVPDEVAQCDIAVMSPGIAKTGELYAWVNGAGMVMTAGTAMFVADHGATMVGVTGSKGKSTTSTLIHHLLVGSGVQATLGGNMGIPVQSVEPGAHQVVELSSYQCSYLEVSPAVVVLTALFPEHLDWHGSVDQYYADKLSIVAGGPRHVVANANDPILFRELTSRYPDLEVTWVGAGQVWHTEEAQGGGVNLMKGEQVLAQGSDVALVGAHNVHNALLALAGADATGLLETASVPGSLRTFAPLPHRLQPLEDPSGIVFVNDSLATNPQATIAALGAFPADQTVIILGGHDRGVDYSPLISYLTSHPPKGIIGLPESGQTLVEMCERALGPGARDVCHREAVGSMTQAVVLARRIAAAGDYVVLSPGAPSFGQYRDFQHRADDFIACITATKENPE